MSLPDLRGKQPGSPASQLPFELHTTEKPAGQSAIPAKTHGPLRGPNCRHTVVFGDGCVLAQPPHRLFSIWIQAQVSRVSPPC